MHAPPYDLKIRAYVSFIREVGTGAFIDCLLRNEAAGIQYGEGRDYDGLDSDDDVHRLLRSASCE
jgi:hypothetical protein